jgi:hypothetical protein
MSLSDAIERNRARQAQKRAGVPTERRNEALRAYTVNVLVNPPVYMIELGLATVHEEKRTIYGTSLADAKKRAGID